MENKKQRQFFVMLNAIYSLMPMTFKNRIGKSKFYRYIQDNRATLGGGENTSLKTITSDNQKAFFVEFFGFVYVHVVGYYYDLDEVEKIKIRLEHEFKTLLS